MGGKRKREGREGLVRLHEERNRKSLQSALKLHRFEEAREKSEEGRLEAYGSWYSSSDEGCRRLDGRERRRWTRRLAIFPFSHSLKLTSLLRVLPSGVNTTEGLHSLCGSERRSFELK